MANNFLNFTENYRQKLYDYNPEIDARKNQTSAILNRCHSCVYTST